MSEPMPSKDELRVLLSAIDDDTVVLRENMAELSSFNKLAGQGKFEQGQVDAHEVMAAGGYLQRFYTSVEAILTRIAKHVDGYVPDGEQWYKELLDQMGRGISDKRSPVLTSDLREELDEYRRFRHVFRHSYGGPLKWQSMDHLVFRAPETGERFLRELGSFKEYLKTILRDG